MKIRLSIAALGGVFFLLATIANPAETGWKYERKVDDFDDSVTYVTSYQDRKGSIFILCGEEKTLWINFLIPGAPAIHSDFAILHARVDKNPQQEFTARLFRGIASVDYRDTLSSEAGGLTREKLHHFVYDLMHGTKLVLRQNLSETVTISLTGSAEPIVKVLKACNVPLPN